VGDFNGDGKQDLAVANNGSHNVSILLRDCALVPTLLSAVSVSSHGAAGNFDINLPLTGTEGVECRRGGGAAFDRYLVLATFASSVTISGVTVTSPDGGSASATQSVTDNVVTVVMTDVTDQHNYIITLTNVNGTGIGVSIPIGILLGDTNGNGAVNAGDVGRTKAQSGQAVTAANFREDVNGDGSISAADVSLVKSNSGAILP